MPASVNPFDSESNRVAANALFDCVKGSRAVALVGAGLSISGGYPSWDGLLLHLEAMVSRASPFYREALKSLRGSPDVLWRAQELRRQLGEDRYYSFLRETFRPRGVAALPGVVTTFVKLPFRHFLTTNFDSLLETAIAGSGVVPTIVDWSNESDVSEFLFRAHDPLSDKCVVHLHGRYNDPMNIVLTDHDYTARYQITNAASQKLVSIFATHQIVFAGFSLTDPALAAR